MKKCKKGITLILVAAMMMSQTVYGQEISPTTSGVFESVADNQSAEETMEVDADGEDVAEETEISEKIITEAVETEEKLATENETFVDGGSCGENLMWGITEYNVLKIYGSGKMTDYFSLNQSTPWYNYHYDITAIEIAEGVSSLSLKCFQDMFSLEKIYFNTNMMEN